MRPISRQPVNAASAPRNGKKPTCSLDHFESGRSAYQTEFDSDVQTCIAGCSPGRLQQMDGFARIRLVAIAQQARHYGCHAARDGVGEPAPRIKPFDSAPAALKQYRPWPDQRPVGPGTDAHEARTAVEDERSDYLIYHFRIPGIGSSYDLGENAGAAGDRPRQGISSIFTSGGTGRR